MRILLIIYMITILISNIYSENQLKFPPLKQKILLIKDGEFFRYGKYIRSEKTIDLWIVNKINSNEASVECYMGFSNDRNPRPLHYSNFQNIMVVSLTKASLIQKHEDIYEYT